MAAAMASSGQFTKLICFDAARRRSVSFFSSKRAALFQHVQIKGLQHQIMYKRTVQSRQYQLAKILATGTSDISISSPSPSHIIRQFYSNINQKNLNQLDGVLSDDCFFEDYSFPKPFQGKQNVGFNVEHICEGDGNTATVNWHLDWREKQIPFTRGCSYYELSRDGERLVIKKIQAVIESPLKLGGLAMAFLKIITSLFDTFPDAAERFLNRPHAVFQLLLKLYHMVLKPILNPIIVWYLKLWSFLFMLFSITLKIVQYIVKIFNY